MKKALKTSAIAMGLVICIIIISLLTMHFYIKLKYPEVYLHSARVIDNIELPFVDDKDVIGTWESVDFVEKIDDFSPYKKNWKEDLYLKKMVINKNGKTDKPTWIWTKGVIIDQREKTASKYNIEKIDNSTYMFFEWKSGDYIFRHMTPKYYVLKKVQ